MRRRIWANHLPGLLFLGAFGIAAEKILFHLNLLDVDLAGHYASAVSSLQGKHHEFNDQFFSGYTHGLFYPPLEDWLLSGWIRVLSLFSQDGLSAYSSYLLIVFAAYLFSQWRFVMSWGPGWRRNFVAAFLVFMDLVPKLGDMTIQGLSLQDFWRTGLTSQVLSGIFFFQFLSSVLFGGRLFWTILFFSLTFVSHIVLGLSAALLLVFLMLFDASRRREFFTVSLVSALLTAFFWLPLLAHRRFLESTNVFSSTHPGWSFAVLSVFLLLFQKKDRVDRALIAFALFVFLCSGFLPHLIEWSPLGIQQWVPGFHYYRLLVVGVLLLGVVVARLDWRMARFAIPGFLVCLSLNFQDTTYGEVKPASPLALDLKDAGDLTLSGGGRYWVIGRNRTIDFGLDMLLASELPDFRSNKGLYWESNRSNTLLSSYLTTLLKPPSILQYFFFSGFSCPTLGCFLDSYFHTFNIQGVIGTPGETRYGLDQAKLDCYRELFQSGTPQYRFSKSGVVRVYGEEYGVNKLIPRESATRIRMSLVEPIDFQRLGRLPKRYRGFQTWEQLALTESFQTCNDQSKISWPLKVWIRNEDWAEVSSLHQDKVPERKTEGEQVRVSKVGGRGYRIELPESPDPSFYVIKLAAQPGMRFTDERGEVVRHWSTYPHTLIFAKGRVDLGFYPTTPMRVGHWVSVVALFGFLLIQLIFRRFFVQRNECIQKTGG